MKKGACLKKISLTFRQKLRKPKQIRKSTPSTSEIVSLLHPLPESSPSKMIERGSAVAPAVPAFQIVKTDKVYARALYLKVRLGSSVNGMASGVFVKTLNETFYGKITIINPQADPVSKTYDVKVKLDNTSGRLLPGMIADMAIRTGKNVDVITIPAKAIVRDADDVAYVFITNDQNKAVRKRVEVKGITGENEIIVTGLNIGDKVVVAGQSRLKEGILLVASL